MVPGWVGEFVKFSNTPVRFKEVVEELVLELDVLPPEKLGVGLQVELEVHVMLFAF